MSQDSSHYPEVDPEDTSIYFVFNLDLMPGTQGEFSLQSCLADGEFLLTYIIDREYSLQLVAPLNTETLSIKVYFENSDDPNCIASSLLRDACGLLSSELIEAWLESVREGFPDDPSEYRVSPYELTDYFVKHHMRLREKLAADALSIFSDYYITFH